MTTFSILCKVLKTYNITQSVQSKYYNGRKELQLKSHQNLIIMRKHLFALTILTAITLITSGNVIRGANPHFSQTITGNLAFGITSSENDPEQENPTDILTGNTRVDGNNCTNAIDLGQITSPYSGSTTPASNSFSFCEMGWSKDLIFYYDLAVGDGITIWLSWNNFDTRHTLRWGGNCPGDFEIECIDDPDYTPITWINNTGETQRVWFIIAGYYEYHGDFTLEWIYFNCEPYEVPFSENFDSSSGMPVCWSYDGSGTFHMGYVSDYQSNSMPNSFYIYQYMATAVLSTPQIAEPAQNLTLSFWAMVEFGEEQLQIGTLSNDDISTFSEFMTVDLSEDWQNYVVPFSSYQGSDTYIGFSYTGLTGAGSIYIDDIVIEYSTLQYTIDAAPNNPEWGSVEGAGIYEHGEIVTLTAIAAANYTFIEWQENGVAVSSDNVYSFTALSNRTLMAKFDLLENVAKIAATAKRITIYPNPANSMITLYVDNNSTGLEAISVFDMLGNEVISVKNPAKAALYILDISTLNSGAYVVRVVATEGTTNTRLIVK